MTTPEWIKIVAAAIGGAGGFGILNYFIGNKKLNQEADNAANAEFRYLVELYKKQLDEYKATSSQEIKELREEVQQLRVVISERESEVQSLRHQLMIFESSQIDIPLPVWLKDTEGKMLFVNSEYERMILEPVNKTSEDYIGCTDYEIWPQEVAATFRRNDQEVMRKKKPIEFIEKWYGANGVKIEGRLLKYPRFLNRNTVIGIGGIIIDAKVVQDEE